jgi:hypothetical protein
MKSKRSQEGYLLVNHKDSPGGFGSPGGVMVELPTFTCSHCQRIVMMNIQRTRDRGYCPKCDHYLCDTCEAARAAGGTCYTYKQYLDELQNAAVKASEQRNPALLAPNQTSGLVLTDAL